MEICTNCGNTTPGQLHYSKQFIKKKKKMFFSVRVLCSLRLSDCFLFLFLFCRPPISSEAFTLLSYLSFYFVPCVPEAFALSISLSFVSLSKKKNLSIPVSLSTPTLSILRCKPNQDVAGKMEEKKGYQRQFFFSPSLFQKMSAFFSFFQKCFSLFYVAGSFKVWSFKKCQSKLCVLFHPITLSTLLSVSSKKGQCVLPGLQIFFSPPLSPVSHSVMQHSWGKFDYSPHGGVKAFCVYFFFFFHLFKR